MCVCVGHRFIETSRFVGTSNRTMVAIATCPRQTIDAGEILRKFLAMHLLYVQFCVRHYCAVEQTVAVGR